MNIISISVSDQILGDMDRIQAELGFAGRSELLRAGIRMMLADKKNRDNMSGHMKTILVVTHDEGVEGPVTSIKHEYDDIVKSHIHYKIAEKKCMELMILEGDAEQVKGLYNKMQTSGKADNVKLIIP